jgi:hypothetical protein
MGGEGWGDDWIGVDEIREEFDERDRRDRERAREIVARYVAKWGTMPTPPCPDPVLGFSVDDLEDEAACEAARLLGRNGQ